MTQGFCGFLLGLGGRGFVEGTSCMAGTGPGFRCVIFSVNKCVYQNI